MITRRCDACSTSCSMETRMNTKQNVVSNTVLVPTRNSQNHRLSIKTHSIIDPSSMSTEETYQAISAVATSVILGGLAIAQGLKSEPKPCPSCATSGGEACIFCNATGRRETPIEITKRERRDDSVLGLTRRSPMECTACKGAGMILCKTCKGSGYV